ncbi:MAG: hypothetical protein OXC28_07155 [Defluviicoccus sp.]|nr:hypothetical protein [Defluviicoccus sp.]
MDTNTPAVTITAKRDGFFRCGLAHPGTPTAYEPGRWSGDELDRLRAEPMLVVVPTADMPAGEGAAAALDRAIAVLREAPAGAVREFFRRISDDQAIRAKLETEIERQTALIAAIDELDPDNREHFTAAGKPKTDALEEAAGLRDVTAAERDAAWEEYLKAGAAE